MNAAGVLDDVQVTLSDETAASANMLKKRALAAASDFRNTIRHRFNPKQLESLLETDRMATLGASTGAVLGFLL